MPIDLHPLPLHRPARFSIRAFHNFTWLLAVLAGFGCTAHRKPSSVETALANAAKDIVIPIEADNMTNPLTASPPVLERGSELYQQNCAVCHGADGHGQTVLGQGMYPPAWI
jgi:mono/diheme cytochrome c family protein